MKVIGRAIALLGTASLALVPALWASSTSAGAAPTSEVFTTVGTTDWIVPAGVTCVTADAIGAEGGSNPVLPDTSDSETAAATNGNGPTANVAGDGAPGGSGTATFTVVPGASVQVDVGGRGGDASLVGFGGIPPVGGVGGFNGGGDGGSPSIPLDLPIEAWSSGAGGGGASDVRVGGTDLASRVAVGGGGGGFGGFLGTDAGVGGGENGGDGGDEFNSTGGHGGTQVEGGAGGTTDGGTPVGGDGVLGSGGNGAGDGATTNGGGGGGGGGYYGGGGGGGVKIGELSAAAGGGGSGLGAEVDSGIDAGNGGNGKVTLSYTAGDTSCASAPLTIKKVATGSVTPGQSFTMHVACADDTIELGGSDLSQVDLQFVVDGAGTVQPAIGQTIGFTGPTDCTVTETVAGGATSTSYACVGRGASDAGETATADGGWGVGAATAANPDDPCATSGPQTTPVSVAIVAPGQEATVTVTNVLPAAASAPAAIGVQPRFTG